MFHDTGGWAFHLDIHWTGGFSRHVLSDGIPENQVSGHAICVDPQTWLTGRSRTSLWYASNPKGLSYAALMSKAMLHLTPMFHLRILSISKFDMKIIVQVPVIFHVHSTFGMWFRVSLHIISILYTFYMTSIWCPILSSVISIWGSIICIQPWYVVYSIHSEPKKRKMICSYCTKQQYSKIHT